MDRTQLRRTGLYPLDPDEFALQTATYVMFKPCPFCGSQCGPVMDYCNETPTFGSKPVYRSVLACRNDYCTAQVSYNGYTREEARKAAIARWQERRPAHEREPDGILRRKSSGEKESA